MAEPTTPDAACGAPLLRPVFTEKDGTVRLIKGFRTSSYRRMRANQPASTITTASGHIGSHFTIHPTEHRLLSPYECQHLQTFPVDFEWGDALKKWGVGSIRAMIGEAVPPLFTRLHGDVLVRLLGNQNAMMMQASDRRHQLAISKISSERQTALNLT